MVLLGISLLWTLPSQAATITRATYSMGTVFRAVVIHSSADVAAEAAEAAFDIIRKQDQLLSDYLDESELSQAQKRAWPNPVPISHELFAALEQALYFSRISQGAFDISIRPLVSLWGFRGGPEQVPDEQFLAQTLEKVGYQKVQLLPHPPQLKLNVSGMQLDFGGIGKGRALDLATAELRRRGIHRAALSCDSSAYFLGSPPQSPQGWPVAVRHPRDPQHILHTLWLRDQGLSTSGDDQQFFEFQGQRYSHILDPRTGKPALYSGSLTVIARSAAQADALSTALLVLPLSDATTLIKSEKISALRVWDASGHWQSEWLGQKPD